MSTLNLTTEVKNWMIFLMFSMIFGTPLVMWCFEAIEIPAMLVFIVGVLASFSAGMFLFFSLVLWDEKIRKNRRTEHQIF